MGMHEELRDFGLTENEIKIYLTLLSMDSSSPSEIAEKTGLSRPYVYDVLERLLEKQMVSTILKKNKKHYTAVDPKRLVELARQKMDTIEKVVPELMKLRSSSKEKIKVELHKGRYVYKILLNDILVNLKKGDEVLIYGIDDETLVNLDRYTPIYLDQYLARINKLKIKERLIGKEGSLMLPEAKTTKYRFLPKKIIGSTAFEVYGNKVAIFLWGDPSYLILIENKEVADSYRNQFEMIWKQAKS